MFTSFGRQHAAAVTAVSARFGADRRGSMCSGYLQYFLFTELPQLLTCYARALGRRK